MSMLTSQLQKALPWIYNYPHQSAGLNRIITVLDELHESISPDKLLVLAKSSSILSWQQRLGFMLEIVNALDLAEVLKIHLSNQKRVDYIPLATDAKVKKNVTRNSTWKIIENIKIESDI